MNNNREISIGAVGVDNYENRIHRAEVENVVQLGPGMIRITFSGEDMADFPTSGIGDERVSIYFPKPGETVPVVPIGSKVSDGALPEGDDFLPARVYTIRYHYTGAVDVDFVVHDGGVASAWAMRAKVGDIVGMSGVGSSGQYRLPDGVTRQLLVADEPGFPAALRIAEQTGPGIETTLLLEVGSEERKLLMERNNPDADITYRWLVGSGNAVTPSRLLDAVKELSPGEDIYVWGATEGKTHRALRRYFRIELRMPEDHYNCVCYWTEASEKKERRRQANGGEFVKQVEELWKDKGRDAEEIVDDIHLLMDKFEV